MSMLPFVQIISFIHKKESRMLNKIIRYFLENKLLTVIILILLVTAGIIMAPFGWKTFLPSDPVPVDAIPDIGENQQIVFVEWPGRSPQDIEDQISYPLTSYLLGIPGVKSIRSNSIFGFSSIYIIFDDKVEFYWSRSRILEKLNSLPAGLLPDGVTPTLGPDATALGQVYWYTLEGLDPDGNPTGGWDLHEIRSVQDYFVKYALNATEGVSEVASVGGYVQEYQVDVDPDALKAYNISLHHVMDAVRRSNRDIGAKTIEINQAEYLVRGLGYVKGIDDIKDAVVTIRDDVPVRIGDIAKVTLGPATRRGALDKNGADVVGGVVVARFGANPLEVINNVKAKIDEISPGLPQKTLADGTKSQLTIVPFYDRSILIKETLGTLEDALSLEILITILVIVIMVFNLRASILISGLLPVSVLMVFIAMRYFGVDANIVALSGIAIAIGTMVDLGIIMSENIIKHLEEAPLGENLIEGVARGASEVSSAILTAVSTTIVSFIPVFTLQQAEGKLFGPLAFTKTFALISALLVTLLILPAFAHWVFGWRIRRRLLKKWGHVLLIALGIVTLILGYAWPGVMLILYAAVGLFKRYFFSKERFLHSKLKLLVKYADLILIVGGVAVLLGKVWLPLGAGRSILLNILFVVLIVGVILSAFLLIQRYYTRILAWTLKNKWKFLAVPIFMIVFAVTIWQGFNTTFGFLAAGPEAIGWKIRDSKVWTSLSHSFPGIGKEFMPSLDEGSFLLMPTSMPHSGIEYNRKVAAQLDQLVTAIPEVESTVGKLGRVDSALDPAPISMFENVINYKPEYIVNDKGHRVRFKVNKNKEFILKDGRSLSQADALTAGIGESDLIPNKRGRYFRNWRAQIKTPDDIWDEIVKASAIPGVTSAPKLQPIETRLVMLQTGMRAPMGIKVHGPDLETIQNFGFELETLLKQVHSVKADAVFADRIVGKPYLNIRIDRQAIARYGLDIEDVQQSLETAVGGMKITSTVEGRERYGIRVRYPRELRETPTELSRILVSTPTGVQVPLDQLVTIEYQRGPQMIRSEETFLTGYVLFDKNEGYSEVETVEDARHAIEGAIDRGELTVPPGVSYVFSGNYENEVRAMKRLSFIVPLVLLIVFLILYFQFRSVSISLMVFSGIALAFSGAFILLWLYGQSWFADFSIFGMNLRELFQMHPINLSVAVWVGFIALFGIATDDGVLMGTYLQQRFKRECPTDIEEIRLTVIQAAKRRIRPASMTSATTIIALLPVLTSTGRGADIMVPMAIPAFGGMLMAVVTYFLVPTLYALREERKLKKVTHETR
jgi:Cu(I)/Ag(I) efflux system membrane protein CusA/SilA